MRNHDIAVEIGKLGLLSHPHDPILLNNIIYSLCLNNNIQEAELLFQKVNKSDLLSKGINNICLLATKGLLYYRKGNPEHARALYLEAMELAKSTGHKSYISKAFVNMTREEILLGQQVMSDAIPKLKDISKKTDDEDLKIDIQEVLDIYNKKR